MFATLAVGARVSGSHKHADEFVEIARSIGKQLFDETDIDVAGKYKNKIYKLFLNLFFFFE